MNERDLNDLLMEAEADFQEIVSALDKEFAGSPTAGTMKSLWMGLPDASKKIVQQADPGLYDEVNKLMAQK